MSVLPSMRAWRRTDGGGWEQVVFADRQGLTARGVAMGLAPVPFTATYQLLTDEAWGTALFEVEAEGAGWWRHVRLERAAGRWRITTGERGRLDRVLATAGSPGATLPGTDLPEQLDEALDVDLLNSPLTNTLPVRRLGLADRAGERHEITAAFVLLPTLTVVASRQAYTVHAADRVGYSSGDFSAEVELDADGFVRRYEGLAERVG